MTVPAKKETLPLAKTIEDVLIAGDLSKLSAEQRTEYYMRVCQSLGLNPMTRPFDYLVLNSKLQLYARRDAADQLRKLHGISIEIVSQDSNGGLLSVHVRAKDKDGRTDEDLGVVSLANAKGDVAANLILKAVTKAKRRVTLSICGLGFLDETEVEDIPALKKTVLPSDDPYPQGQQEQEQQENIPHQTKSNPPHQIDIPFFPSGKRDWFSWGKELIAKVRAAKTKAEGEEWLTINAEALEVCADEDTSVWDRFDTAVKTWRATPEK